MLTKDWAAEFQQTRYGQKIIYIYNEIMEREAEPPSLETDIRRLEKVNQLFDAGKPVEGKKAAALLGIDISGSNAEVEERISARLATTRRWMESVKVREKKDEQPEKEGQILKFSAKGPEKK